MNDAIDVRGPTSRPAAQVGVLALALGLGVTMPYAFAQSVPVQNVQKIPQLEEAVRDLRQRLEAESRRVDALERELARASPASSERISAAGQVKARSEATPKWLHASSWAGLRRGMRELEAIESLGPPSALRPSETGSGKVAHYALEIEPGAFLSGSVTFEGGRVVAVDTPRLR